MFDSSQSRRRRFHLRQPVSYALNNSVLVYHRASSAPEHVHIRLTETFRTKHQTTFEPRSACHVSGCLRSACIRYAGITGLSGMH